MKSYGAFHTLMQRLASTRVGAWYFSLTQQQLDSVFLRIGGGRTATTLLAGLPVVIVSTRGAKTGEPRTVPLLCIRTEDNADEFAIVGTNFGRVRNPAWYFNLKAHPKAECTVDGNIGQFVAHEADDEEYARYWQLAQDTYLGFPKYRHRIGDRRRIPILVMRSVN